MVVELFLDLGDVDDHRGGREVGAQPVGAGDAVPVRGPARQLLEAWPTVSFHPELYAELVNRRMKLAGSSEPEAWAEMIKLHQERFRAFKENLADGYEFQLILPRTALSLPEAGTNGEAVTFAERRKHFEFVLTELLEKDNFQVGIAPDKWTERINSCRWSVNEPASGGGGVVSVQTFYTPPLDGFDVRQSQKLRVDLKIEAPGAVRAFSSYFAHVWDESDRSSVRELLEKALRSGA